jgi:F-type H+-transporting ATPase subunit epsilon
MELEVVTPTGSVLSRTVKEVIVPATDGLMGILEGHADIMVGLGDGRLSINDGRDSVEADVKGGGFLQVDGDKVYVLAEFVDLVN